MTRFEELTDIISKKKNKNNPRQNSDEGDSLEVAGSESSKTPLLSCADDDIDGSIIHDLYRKPWHKPLMGEFAEKWD